MTDTKEEYNIDYERIKELVAKYEEIKQSGEIKHYKEEETKKDFILPLFEALGWNVYNKGISNDSITAEESIGKGRADYGFRINGIPMFFLEAKSLKEEDIQTQDYVRQAITYAYNKACPWAILTNFETIQICNASWKLPNPMSSVPYTLYAKNLLTDSNLIYLSKKAFENKELDKKPWGRPVKKPINKQLLDDMIDFRDRLSKDIKMRNKDRILSDGDVDEAVQRILDRLIFIRNAEDRGMEENELLSKQRIWGEEDGKLAMKLSKVYEKYNNKYDSKLFDTHLCDIINIGNDVLIRVIEGLNHDRDTTYIYDFSIIESDTLGNIYEQYLGNILQAKKGNEISESSSHRKEQGIYYTPSYIVDYIVKNTVNEYIKTHTSEEIGNVKVLDMSCGSGSFLIGAYKELSNYWKNKYNDDKSMKDMPESERSEVFYNKKIEILKKNIYGVDLDAQAVEIAQLNLLLRISQKNQKLPSLQGNIKSGNSLIDDTLISDKAFKWGKEFPDVMKEGGFDIIIGNPPYINIKSNDILKNAKDFKELSNGIVNSATLFLKKGLDLLNDNGYLGMIIPKSFAYVDSWKPIRRVIYENTQLLTVVDVGMAFEDVLLEQVIIIMRKQKPKLSDKVCLVSGLNTSTASVAKISYGEIIKNDKISLQSSPIEREVYEKINTGAVLLGDISDNFRGLGVQKLILKGDKSGERILSGKEIQRFYTDNYHNYFINVNEIPDINKVKNLRVPKIMVQNIVSHFKDHIRITATYDSTGVLNLDTVNNIVINNINFNPKYILALLNSKIISYYTHIFIYSNARMTMHFDRGYSGKIPIKELPKEEQSYFETRVDRLLELNKEFNESKNKLTDKIRKLQEEIISLEKEINNKIYEIYGITEEEKKVIEESS